MVRITRKAILFFILVIFLCVIFLIEYKIVGQAIYGDGRYYLAVTRSIYFSQDIDISDDMAGPWNPEGNNKPVVLERIPKSEKDFSEYISNFSMGISIIWLPIYAVADISAAVLNQLGFNPVRNGYSDIYQISLGLGNIIFVSLGFLFLYKLLLKYHSRFTSITSLGLLLLSTNLYYYSSIDVVNTHPFSFLSASLVLFLFFLYDKTKNANLFFLQGIVIGLMVANRMQDALFILVPLFSAFSILQDKVKRIKAFCACLFIFALGFVLGYLPQLWILSASQPEFAVVPHSVKVASDFTPLAFTKDILINPDFGIVIYMPILLASFFGMYLFYRRTKNIALPLITILLMTLLLISSYDGWNAAGYTMRYFISVFPILVFGIAEVVSLLARKYSKFFISLVAVAFVVHQFVALVMFKFFIQGSTMVGTELSQSGQLKLQILQFVQGFF